MTKAELEKLVAEQMAILLESYPELRDDLESYHWTENFIRSCLYKKYVVKGG